MYLHIHVYIYIYIYRESPAVRPAWSSLSTLILSFWMAVAAIAT